MLHGYWLMSALTRLSRRSFVWLLPAIAITLVALMVVQYRFLRKLETATAKAHREQISSYLADVAATAERTQRAAAERALDITPEMAASGTAVGRMTGSGVRGARYFFIERYDVDPPGFRSYWDAKGNPIAEAPQPLARAVKMATLPWWVVLKEKSIVSQRSLVTDERDKSFRMVTRPILNDAWQLVGVAGIVYDNEAVRQDLLRTMRTKMLEHFPEAEQRSTMNASIVTAPPPSSAPLVAQPLHFLFSDWQVSAKDTCVSPEELAACSFRMQMMWSGAIFLLLGGAIGLALRAAAKEMRLSQMKSDFVSNVSHELRTPLSSIRVFGEYLRLGRVQQPEKIREYGEYIENESRRLTQLINNILDFSKLESAEKIFNFRIEPIDEVVRECVSAFATPLRSAVDVELDCESNLPPVSIDRDAIAQVVANLLDNAVKYSDGERRVIVQLRPAEGGVALSVRDFGPGIDDCEKQKIFEKFYRVSSGLVHDVKGSGLGLAIVRHIVAAHGGRIEVENNQPRGTVFTVYLPAAQPSAQPGTIRQIEAQA
jgi:signal transduction histidine kinase